MLPTTDNRPMLPPELWSRILFWATYSPTRDNYSLINIPIFDGITYSKEKAHSEQALQVKASLALVCKQWRTLSERFLYEDIRIRHGKRILAEVLERSRKECLQDIGIGKYTTRIELTSVGEGVVGFGANRHWADTETARIIKCCPNLLVLSRYCSIYVKTCHSTQDPSLPAIRRLDWSNSATTGGNPAICVVPSAIWTAHELEVLSLTGDNYFWDPLDLQSRTSKAILLPKIHTLRVGSLHAFGLPGICTYALDLPSLRRVILDRGEALHRLIECVLSRSLSPYNQAVGTRVTALEIGTPHWRFTRSDYISTLIRHCPSAETLHYPVFHARPLRWSRFRDNGTLYGSEYMQSMPESLRHVGLHAEPNLELMLANADGATDAIWSHLYAHARALLGSTSPITLESRLPGIRSVTLHGHEWAPLVEDIRFHTILDLARVRGARISAEDPAVAKKLSDAMFAYSLDLVVEWVHEL